PEPYTLSLHELFRSQGEIFGLLGPNGAGKTTTFLCLTHQVTPSSGRVTVLGHDVAREFASIKPRFGFVPDSENHFDEFTAWQNLDRKSTRLNSSHT